MHKYRKNPETLCKKIKKIALPNYLKHTPMKTNTTASIAKKHTPKTKVPKQFMACLNKLTNAQAEGLTKFEVQALLYQLEEIAFEHFNQEHQKVLLSGKKTADVQIKQDNNFLLKIQDFAFDHLYGKQNNYQGFVKYLKNWTANYSTTTGVALG